MAFSRRKMFYSAVLLLCIIVFAGACSITEFLIDTQIDKTQNYGHIKEKINAVIEKQAESDKSDQP